MVWGGRGKGLGRASGKAQQRAAVGCTSGNKRWTGPAARTCLESDGFSIDDAAS